MLKPKHVLFGTPPACFIAWLVMMYKLPQWADFGPPQTAFTVTMGFLAVMVPILIVGSTPNKDNWFITEPEPEED